MSPLPREYEKSVAKVSFGDEAKQTSYRTKHHRDSSFESFKTWDMRKRTSLNVSRSKPGAKRRAKMKTKRKSNKSSSSVYGLYKRAD